MNKRLAVLGLAFAIALTTRADDEATSGKIQHETWEKTYPVSENLTLSVQNGAGRIYIYGSEANELAVTAVKRAFTKERLDGIAIRVAREGETATIRTIMPPVPPGGIARDRSGTVDYTMIVPQNCTIAQAELTNGEIIIEGIRGPSINARVGNGRLLTRDCFSQKQMISIGRGGMDVFFNWWESEPLSLEAEIGDGDLRIGFPEDVSVRLEAGAARGHIKDRFTEDEHHGDVRTLSTTLGSGGPSEVKLQAGNGNIKLEKSY